MPVRCHDAYQKAVRAQRARADRELAQRIDDAQRQEALEVATRTPSAPPPAPPRNRRERHARLLAERAEAERAYRQRFADALREQPIPVVVMEPVKVRGGKKGEARRA